MAKQLVLDIQREVRARQTLARNILPQDVSTHPTGVHIWMPLPGNRNRQLFARALEQKGVLVACSGRFRRCAESVDAVRLSIGGARDQGLLGQALQQVAGLLYEERRRGGRTIV